MHSDFQISGVSESKSDGALCRVSFACRLPGLVPVDIKRSFKNDKGEWKDWTVATVLGACTVQTTGQIREGKDGGYWLSCDVSGIPSALRDEIVKAACAAWLKRSTEGSAA